MRLLCRPVLRSELVLRRASGDQPSARPVAGKTRATQTGDLDLQRQAEAASVSALADIRSTAEKWAGSLSALLTGAGIAALIDGPKHFDALAHTPQLWGKGLFFGGAVIGVAAALCAALAAQATAKRIWVSASEYRRSHEGLAERAWCQLATSRLLALLAISLLLASTAVLWFGKPKAKAHPAPMSAPPFTRQP